MVKKICFGVLEKVFPPGDKGLREVRPECFQCPKRVSCLKTALDTREGVEMRAEILERAPAKGLMGRIKRWSHKKALSRCVDREKKKTQ
jgi:hypothetical protein